MFLKFRITKIDFSSLLGNDMFLKYNRCKDVHQPFLKIELNEVFNRFDSKENVDVQPNTIKIPLYDLEKAKKLKAMGLDMKNNSTVMNYKSLEKNGNDDEKDLKDLYREILEETPEHYKIESSQIDLIPENSIGLMLVSLYLPKMDDFDTPCMVLQSTSELVLFNDLLFKNFNETNREKREASRVHKTKLSNANNDYGFIEIELEEVIFQQKELLKNKDGKDGTFPLNKKNIFDSSETSKTPFVSREEYEKVLKDQEVISKTYDAYIRKDLKYTKYLPHAYDTYNNKERTMFPNEALMHKTYKTSSNYYFWENAFNLAMVFIEDHIIYEHLYDNGTLKKENKNHYSHKDIYCALPNIKLRLEVLSHLISITVNHMRYVSDVRLDLDYIGRYKWNICDNFNDMSELAGNCSDMTSFTHYVFECFKKFDPSQFKDKNHQPLLELHQISQHYECCVAYCMLEHDLHMSKSKKSSMKKKQYVNHQKKRKFNNFNDTIREQNEEILKTQGMDEDSSIDSELDIYHSSCLLINKSHLLNSISDPDTNFGIGEKSTGEVALGISRLLEMEIHMNRNGYFNTITGEPMLKVLPKIVPMETTFLLDPEYYDDDELDEINNLDGKNDHLNEKLDKHFNVERLTQTKKHPLIKRFYYLLTNLFIDNDYAYPINVPILRFQSKNKKNPYEGVTFHHLFDSNFEIYYQFNQKTFEKDIKTLKLVSSTKPQRLGLFSPPNVSTMNSKSIYNSILMHNGTCQFLNPMEHQEKEIKNENNNFLSFFKIKVQSEEDDDGYRYKFGVATFLEEDFLKLTYGVDYLVYRKVELLKNKLIIYIVWF